IDRALEEIKDSSQTRSQQVQEAVESAVSTIKDSEEVAILQKRYAQLKAQLAIVQANLASRYGEQYEDVKHYLDEAKAWYERAKDDPETFTEPLEDRRKAFEEKLGEAGRAIAQKESRMKQVLRELWKSVTDLFRDKN
ncbi:MAG: histidine kinase, partial [Cyanobacteriota bacterium]|nr:histidine kinase [Cyanobacteriota bacterium]